MRIRITGIVWSLAVLTMLVAAGCTKGGDGAAQSAGTPQAANPMEDRGVGPITTDVKLEAINPKLVTAGQELFKAKCSACHKIEEKYVGPALRGVTQRRRPEWIMNMILNPAEMTQKDPIAKDLLATHFTQMTFQNVNQDEVRKILEFFRQNDATSK